VLDLSMISVLGHQIMFDPWSLNFCIQLC